MQVKLGLLHLIRSQSEKNYIVLTFFFHFAITKGQLFYIQDLLLIEEKFSQTSKSALIHFVS